MSTTPAERKDRGQQIPGSKYFRDYCVRCGDPLRVTENRLGAGQHAPQNYCEDCWPPLPPPVFAGLTPRQLAKLKHT